MYIQPEFFDWPYDHGAKTGVDYELRFRAHDIWRHAQDCLTNEESELYRADAICTLKRAINHRLKALSSVYNFEALPWPGGKKKILEKYKFYGLVRPALIQDLIEVRNAVEHEDIPPPSVDKCNYLVDIVWYFLKSTDSLIDMKIDDLEFEKFDTQNHIRLNINTGENWKTMAHGTVHNSMLSKSNIPNSLKINNYQGKVSGVYPDYVEISGNIIFKDDALVNLAREYFGAAGYWYEDHV